MNSSTSLDHSRPSWAEVWASAAPYVIPPAAASVAIIPTFWGLAIKAAQQTDQPIPRMTWKEAFRGGIKVSPTIGFIVGTQMMVQNVVEKTLLKTLEKSGNEKPNFSIMVLSTTLVAGISAPPLAVFNGCTMGRSAKESLNGLNTKQTMAIVAREASFLFGLRITTPLNEALKQFLGDNNAVEYGSTFAGGYISTLIGHPADTMLTRLQKKLVTHPRHYMQGGLAKALTVGTFSVLYKLANDILQSKTK